MANREKRKLLGGIVLQVSSLNGNKNLQRVRESLKSRVRKKGSFILKTMLRLFIRVVSTWLAT